MSAYCQLTGVKPVFGNNVSHSHRRTRRRWDPNIQQRRYWLPGEDRFVRLTVSARAIKTIDKIGVEAAVARIRARGEKI
ncbi:large subunit ribosomal protein L28 [Nonomuraea solani]|uniref:Large ribosomal subunit protein bL28 n=1 Tax=Nonomuraea solani TaxID=1144553 RepID=A0A1H6F1G5_9ACTN|nr:50S ribosomal protein L28 [Nonomuraea solani]SEH03039.1 large subunit ribosomal protein L28 [Nonomuraea solani]